MKGLIFIVLVLVNCINLFAQIKDGSYTCVLPVFLDLGIIIEIKNNNINAYEYSTMGTDSTVGTFVLADNYLNIQWNFISPEWHTVGDKFFKDHTKKVFITVNRKRAAFDGCKWV